MNAPLLVAVDVGRTVGWVERSDTQHWSGLDLYNAGYRCAPPSLQTAFYNLCGTAVDPTPLVPSLAESCQNVGWVAGSLPDAASSLSVVSRSVSNSAEISLGVSRTVGWVERSDTQHWSRLDLYDAGYRCPPLSLQAAFDNPCGTAVGQIRLFMPD